MTGVRCPHCRNVLVFRELDVGDVRKCPKCKEWFAIPSPLDQGPRVCPRCRNELGPEDKVCVGCGFGSQAGEEFPPPPGAIVEQEERSRPRRRAPKRAIIGLAALVLLALAVWFFWEPIRGGADRALYLQAQQSDRPADYRRYLEMFPRGRHAEEARERLREVDELGPEEDVIEGQREVDPPLGTE